MKRFLPAFILILSLFISPAFAQQVDWVHNGGGDSQDDAFDIVTDEIGNSYVTGGVTAGTNFNPTFDGDTIKGVSGQFYVVKYDVRGDQKWVVSGGGTSQDIGTGITLSNDDKDLILVGYYKSTNATFDTFNLPAASAANARLFVAKMDTSGSVKWVKTAEVGNVWVFTYYYWWAAYPKVVVDTADNIYVSGGYRGTAKFDTTTLNGTTNFDFESFVVKYDKQGTLKWAKNTTGPLYTNINDITIDKAQNIYLAGRFSQNINLAGTQVTGNVTSYDAFLAKMDVNGKVLWVKDEGGTGFDDAAGVAIDKDNLLYMSGSFQNTATFDTKSVTSTGGYDIFVTRYDTSGKAIWAKNAGGTSFDYAYGIDVDNRTNAGITGRFLNKAKFGTTELSSLGFYGIYFSLIDSSGTFLWAQKAGGSSFDQGNSISLDSSKNIYACGEFNGIAAFGDKVAISNKQRDAFIVKVSDCIDADTAIITSPAVTSVCNGDSVRLTSNNKATLDYQWMYNGVPIVAATDTVYKAHISGDYSVIIWDDGCYDTSDVVKVTVNANPNATLSNFPTTCIGDADFTLTQGSPSGGIYKGIGIKNDTVFSPATSGLGSFNINYVYTDTNGCSDSANKNITVGGQTAVLFPYSDVCENQPAFSLFGGAPLGGTYQGPGVTNNIFDPSVAGAGTHTISYIYTSLGCSDTATATITVKSAPNATISAIPDQCESTSFIVLSAYGTPAGGYFIGTGVNFVLFYPGTAGPGNHNISYIVSSGGCNDTATTSVKVDSLPKASLAAIAGMCVYDASFPLTGGSPAGGSYRINGAVATTFDPGALGAGTHTVQYIFSNLCGADTASQSVTVNAKPTVTLGAFTAICANAGDLTLTGGSPAGGSYFGNHISAGKFSPSSAGAGLHTINYTYSDGNGCKDTATQTIQVHAAPTVTLSAINAVCVDAAAFALSGGSPTGGTYSGTGVSGGQFNPATAGVGTHTITYKYTNANNCTDSAQTTVTVNPLPTVTFSALASTCLGTGSFALSGGSPTGGTYSGTGVSGGQFDPATAGVGTHTITYTYTDGNNCSNSATQSITVNPQPTVTLSSFTAVCAGDAAFTLSGGSPAGGTYKGTGVSAGQFDPAIAGAGTHAITYVYTDGNSCIDSASQNLVVHAQPTVTLSVINAVCVDAAAFALSGGSPTGGTYSGTGVSGGQFNPATAGVGTHTITYKYTNANNCTDSAQTTVTVNPLPTVTFSALASTCLGTGSFALSGGSPAGGTYSGTGVSGGQFDPATAGVGTHTITYTYTDGNNCSNSATQSITVNPQPTVTLSSFTAVCAGDAAFTLSGGSPAGGTYKGTGVSAGQFDPATAGAGTHAITYVYTDGNSCIDSASQNLVVHAQPTVTLSAINAVCVDAAAFALSGGSPTGGTYSGTGVSGGQFNPATAGVGTHTITYKYTNANNCTDSAQTTVTVNPLPTVTFSALASTCLGTGSFALSGGSPTGGTYSGTGVSGGQFDPATAGVGTHTITYTYTDGNNCSNSATQSITVNPQPTVTLSSFTAVCAGDAAFTLSGGSPAGGTYKGTGVSAGQFDPATAGAGTHAITYVYTDGNSCIDSASQNLVVHAQPTVTLSAINAVCVDAAAFALSGGSPTGGTYSGTGVSGGQFNPATAGVGTHTITYKYTNANNCTDSAQTTVTVNPLPTVTFSALASTCLGTGSFALSGGSPTGGTYSGTGVSGGQFDPATAGVGTHTITYTYTDGNNCSNSATQSITVNPQPTVTLSSFTAVCAGDAAFTLSGGSPAGGTYKGTGVSAGQFDPATAGAGTHAITYVYTDGNSCIDSASQNLVVHAQPTVTLSAINAVCVDAAAFALSGGSPTGGTYSGTGVSGGQFNPATAGVGTHTITYKYTNANNCTDSAQTTVTVNPLPTVTFSALASTCLGTGSFALSGGSPTGGTYSGTGVSGGQFDPATAGVGTHTITYTYTDGNNCSNSATQSITVNPQPTVTLSSFTAVCAGDAAFTLSGGSPAGGTYKGTGVSAGQFDPATAGAGTHAITYVYTDGNSCIDSASQNLVVHAQPTVTLSAINAVCVDAAAFALSGGSPTGGTYSGTGVSGGQFNPATAGVGTHTITYKYTNANNCVDSASTNLVVNALPTVSQTALSPVCFGSSAFTLSGGSPSGGSYSGTGVSAGQFDPATAGVGTHNVIYLYTDVNNCSNTDTVQQIVHAQPTVSLAALPDVCAGSPSFTLGGASPSGGTFSGTGVSGSQFSPSTAGAGTHKITYTYTDANSCIDSASQNQIVHAQPSVSIPSFADRCENSTVLTLSGATPSGGTYKGTGVSAGQFDASVAKAGTHTITYVFTDGNSCTDSASTSLTVDTVPIVTFPSLTNICSAANPVNINFATPIGGTYKGNGVVSNSQFDPNVTGVGTFTLWYVFTDGNSCTDSASQTIGVDSTPALTFTLIDSICINGGVQNLTATPTGGTFSGAGVIVNQFSPQIAGNGKQFITYSYTSINGCSNSLTDSVRVDSLTPMTFALVDSLCQNGGALTMSATPTGTNFFGTGVSGNVFDPSGLIPGNTQVFCTYSNSYGCRDTLSETIRIDTIPIVAVTGWAAICSKDSLALTGGTPSGGIYMGAQVSGNTFYAPGGSGKFGVTYRYEDSFGCADSVVDSLQVKPTPNLNVTNPTVLCANTADFTLTTGSPVGGKYFGSGVIQDTIFSPILVGAGNTSLGYTYTDTNGCGDSIQVSWTVDTIPSVGFGTIPDLCENGGRYTLVEGTPSGGSYSGSGVAGGTQFDPTLGFGNYSLSYLFTDGNGCSDSAQQSVQVDSLDRVQAFSPQDICAGSNPITFTSGLPKGGNYHGDGVVQDSIFVPGNRPAGTQTVYYSISSRCGNDTLAANFILQNLPVVTLDSLPLNCQGDPALNLAPYGHPSGGDFYIDGVKKSVLVSGELGSSFDVAYEYTDTNGCVNNELLVVNLHPFPDAEISGSSTWCSADTMAFTNSGENIVSYHWNGDTTDTGTANYQLPASNLELGRQTVTLKVVDQNGCSNEGSMTYTIENCNPGLSIFPNPNDGLFQVAVEVENEMSITLSVINSVGQEILGRDTYAYPGRNIYNIDLIDESGGTYVLRILLEDGSIYMEKMVVQN